MASCSIPTTHTHLTLASLRHLNMKESFCLSCYSINQLLIFPQTTASLCNSFLFNTSPCHSLQIGGLSLSFPWLPLKPGGKPKKVTGMIKLALEAGKATPAPSVGPALGSKGVNIMAFCKDYNARTGNKAGCVIPVKITVYNLS